MANYNRNYGRQNSYDKGYGNNRGYSQNNAYSQNRQPKKHSGAKLTTYTPNSGENKGELQYLVYGWKLNRSKELIQVKCVTTSKSKLSDKGWFGSVACSFTNTVTGETHFHWGTMQKATGKVVIDKVSIVLNPKAKNGGYCGTYIKS